MHQQYLSHSRRGSVISTSRPYPSLRRQSTISAREIVCSILKRGKAVHPKIASANANRLFRDFSLRRGVSALSHRVRRALHSSIVTE